MQKTILWTMDRKTEILELFNKGFNQSEIASILGISQTTVSRNFTAPSKKEREDFYQNRAYGAYITRSGERVLFNRKYQPLEDKSRWVKDIVGQEWFYSSQTNWMNRIYNSDNQIVIYSR